MIRWFRKRIADVRTL